MCLILAAWRVDPRYPCVILANRDENHVRPSAPAGWWSDHPQVLAGRDLEAGGTWLGITRTGRLAALTNYRGPGQRRAEAPSRGELVSGELTSGRTPAQSLAHLRTAGGAYNGFNLLTADGEQLAVYESVPAVGRVLGAGIYGLSNALLDTAWPKVQIAKSALLKALTAGCDPELLLALLRDDRPAPDPDLPDTGVGIELERLLSSAFILSPAYGTRCSTIVRVDARRRVRFDEWTWSPEGAQIGRQRFEFELQPA